MTANLDTLLTALYVFCDDHVIGRRRIGRPPLLSDAELLCPAIAQVLLDFPRERHWIRYARKRPRHLFAYIPDQSGYDKRLRAAGPLIAEAIRRLAEVTTTGVPILRLIDSTPVPCGTSRETAKRSDLAGDAGYGYCASHSRYFWGMRQYLVTIVEGMPVTWCLANPKLGEREVMTALLEVDHHLIHVTDAAPVYPRVLDELVPAAWHHVEQYANNRIEADHSRLKQRLRPMGRLRTDRTTQVIIAGIAFMQNLRRGHYEIATDTPQPLRVAAAFTELARAL